MRWIPILLVLWLHVSGSLSAHHQEFLAVHRLWYILCSCDERLLPGVGWSSTLLLVANGHNWIKCTKTDVQLRTPDYGQKGCLKHVVVIPIKLEFSASVGFIHKVLLYVLITMTSAHYLCHISSWSLQCQIQYAYMIGLHFCAVPGLSWLVPGMDFWHQMA